MKQFSKHITIFFVLFFIVEKGICFFVNNAPKKEFDNRLELVLNGKINKEVIILGSSRGANNISAKQLEDSINQSVYNLSYLGSDVTFHEFILKTLIKYNKPPKKVLLVIDNIFEFKQNSSLLFRDDKLFPLKNYDYINDELIRRKKKNILSRMFCLSKVNREDFNLKKRKIQDGYILTSHGSFLLELKKQGVFNYSNKSFDYDAKEENGSKLEAFKNIQKLCDKQRIELFYVFPPNYKIFNNSFLIRFKQLIPDKKQVILFDTTDVRYKNIKYFKDETHLFNNGAALFTSEISDYLN